MTKTSARRTPIKVRQSRIPLLFAFILGILTTIIFIVVLVFLWRSQLATSSRITAALINGNRFSVDAKRSYVAEGELITVQGATFFLTIQYDHPLLHVGTMQVGGTGVEVTYTTAGKEYRYVNGTITFDGEDHMTINGFGDGWELKLDIQLLDEVPPSPTEPFAGSRV